MESEVVWFICHPALNRPKARFCIPRVLEH
jgi:hypothetical protein